MSVESKIKQLLEGTSTDQEQLSEAEHAVKKPEDMTQSSTAVAGEQAAKDMKKDTSKSGIAANKGDTAIQPNLGNSPKPTFDEFKEDEKNLGSVSASKVSSEVNKSSVNMKGDAKSVKVPAMEAMHKKKKSMMKEEEVEEAEELEEIDISEELNSIFGEDHSDDFKKKATSIFEAAVIARVNNEMDAVNTKLEEHNAVQLQEYKDWLSEKVDSYLNYIVEQWLEENKLSVENGLKNEITEEFMLGLKNLFKENYIEVPEDKYDIVTDLTDKVDSLTTELDESVEDNMTLSNELVSMKKSKVLETFTKDLADTEKEKLNKLVEGVDFENEETYSEKVSVIKENYFPKNKKKSPEDALVEDSETNEPEIEDDVMSKYMSTISRQVKN